MLQARARPTNGGHCVGSIDDGDPARVHPLERMLARVPWRVNDRWAGTRETPFTMARMASVFRADQVGSLLRPATLLQARDAFRQGQLSRDALTAAEDEAI